MHGIVCIKKMKIAWKIIQRIVFKREEGREKCRENR